MTDDLCYLTATELTSRYRDKTLSPVEVMQAFNRTRRHCFPILENDKLVGVVTETDLTRLFRLPSDPETPPFTGETPESPL